MSSLQEYLIENNLFQTGQSKKVSYVNVGSDNVL